MRSLPGKAKAAPVGDKPDLAKVLDWYGVRYSHSGKQKVLCVVHDDSKPSMSVDLTKNLWKCLGGETLVQTRGGVFPIGDLAGSSHELLTTRGWVTAPIHSFGEQELMTITLSRNGRERTVRATPEHRWITSSRAEVTTENLRTAHRLMPIKPPKSGLLVPTDMGIMHGFTFGDGHLEATTGVANFFGEKDAYVMPYFHQNLRQWSSKHRDGTRVYGLPRAFKSLPAVDEYPGYLYGWLAGYFAADGCVDTSGAPTLASANPANLEFVKQMGLGRLGVVTHDIRGYDHVAIGGKMARLYQMSFSRSSLSPEFFLIPEHRKRWQENRQVKERLGYAVRAVERTGEREEVFCATVCGIGNFALDGNLLTGNCHACFKGGDAITMVMEKEHLDFPAALKKLEEITGEKLTSGSTPTGPHVNRVGKGRGVRPKLGRRPTFKK